jgi:hypothetical protein
VDRTCDSTVGVVTVVVALFVGHLDDEEQALTVLRQWQLPDHNMKSRLRDMRYPIFRTCEKVFPGESLALLTPMAAMPTGVVTLSGASLWVPSTRWGSG